MGRLPYLAPGSSGVQAVPVLAPSAPCAPLVWYPVYPVYPPHPALVGGTGYQLLSIRTGIARTICLLLIMSSTKQRTPLSPVKGSGVRKSAPSSKSVRLPTRPRPRVEGPPPYESTVCPPNKINLFVDEECRSSDTKQKVEVVDDVSAASHWVGGCPDEWCAAIRCDCMRYWDSFEELLTADDGESPLGNSDGREPGGRNEYDTEEDEMEVAQLVAYDELIDDDFIDVDPEVKKFVRDVQKKRSMMEGDLFYYSYKSKARVVARSSLRVRGGVNQIGMISSLQSLRETRRLCPKVLEAGINSSSPVSRLCCFEAWLTLAPFAYGNNILVDSCDAIVRLMRVKLNEFLLSAEDSGSEVGDDGSSSAGERNELMTDLEEEFVSIARRLSGSNPGSKFQVLKRSAAYLKNFMDLQATEVTGRISLRTW